MSCCGIKRKEVIRMPDSREAVILLEEEDFLNTKEMIAAILFDYENEESDYVRPHEEDCHELAERILEALRIFPELVEGR